MDDPFLGGDPVSWRGKPYVAHQYPDAPEYRYITSPCGARFVVPASELNDADLQALVEWINARTSYDSGYDCLQVSAHQRDALD